MDNNLSVIIKYLSNKVNPTAIADREANLLWSSDDMLWGSTIKRISFPIETERAFTVFYDGVRCPVTATEYYTDDGKLIYIFEVYSDNLMTQLMKKTEFMKRLKSAVDTSVVEIRRIAGLGLGLSDSLTNRTRREQRKTIETQLLCASDLLAQSMNISCYIDDEFSNEYNKTSNVKTVFDKVYEVFNEKLSRFGREINYVSDTSTGEVGISERKLMIMLLNIVQNAFLYSPKKTQVTMHLTFTRNKAKIKISNYKRKDIDSRVGAGLGRELAERIAMIGGGTFKYSETAKKAIVEIELPIVTTKLRLETSFTSIARDRFSPFNLFLNSVEKYEMGLED